MTITVTKGDIEAAEDLIDAIGSDVTLDSQDAVDAAKAAYDALSDDDKALVNANKVTALNAAVEKIEQIKRKLPVATLSTAMRENTDKTPVRVGDIVTVDITATATETADGNLAALSATLDYDQTVFELVSVTKGAGLSEGASFMPEGGAAEAMFSFYGNEVSAEESGEGGFVVATAMLRALKAADGATVGVKDALGALAGESPDRVVAAGDVASVSVLANVLRGDVNGNNRVNIVDAQLAYDIARAVYTDFSAVSMEGFLKADVNGDASVDAVDAFAIQHFALVGTFSE